MEHTHLHVYYVTAQLVVLLIVLDCQHLLALLLRGKMSTAKLSENKTKFCPYISMIFIITANKLKFILLRFI